MKRILVSILCSICFVSAFAQSGNQDYYVVLKVVGKPELVANKTRKTLVPLDTLTEKSELNIPEGSSIIINDVVHQKQYQIKTIGHDYLGSMLKDSHNTITQLSKAFVNWMVSRIRPNDNISGTRISEKAATTREEGVFDTNFNLNDFSAMDLVKEYQEFRRQCTEEYIDFVRQAWKDYYGEPPLEMPKEKEVPPMLIPANDNESPIVLDQEKMKEFEGEVLKSGDETASWFSFLGKMVKNRKKSKGTKTVKQDQQLAVDNVVENSTKDVKKVKALFPVAPVSEVNNESYNFRIFGTRYEVRVNDACKMHLKATTENDIADGLVTIADSRNDNLLYDFLRIRRDDKLSDWAYYQLIKKFAEQYYGEGTNEATLQLSYLLAQSGYKIRLGRDDQRLVILIASQHRIYNQVSYTMDGDRYYLLNDSMMHLSISRAPFPGELGLSLTIPNAQEFEVERSDIRTIRSKDYPDFQVKVHINKNLINFYNTYLPSYLNDNIMTRWAMYANTPLASDVREELYPQLKSQLQGMSPYNAMNRLLNWVQTGLIYGSDVEQWGADRAFFAEETLFYPYCDCEDRSILLSRLVRDLLGLKVILVYYPGHLAMAVHFNEEVKGDFILLNGEKYIVCDPTFIGAPVGSTMPRMDNDKAQVILLD